MFPRGRTPVNGRRMHDQIAPAAADGVPCAVMVAPHPTGGRRILRDGHKDSAGSMPWATAAFLAIPGGR